MSKEMDKQIEDLLQKISTKKELVAKKTKQSKANWKTNCVFPAASNIFGNIEKCNISIANYRKVKNMIANLITLKESHEKVMKVLDKEEVFEFEGYTYDEWMSDFKTRISRIEIKEETLKLDKLEKKAKALMSEDQKRKDGIEEILKDL